MPLNTWVSNYDAGILSVRYFKKPSLFSFRLNESWYENDAEGNWYTTTNIFNTFFTTDLKRISLNEELKRADIFVISESVDKIVIHREVDDAKYGCLFDYSLENSFVLQN